MANDERLNIIISAQNLASSVLNSIKSQIMSIGAAYLSWQGAKKVFDMTISAAAESEVVWTRVAGAVKNVGENSKRVTPILQEFANTFTTRFGIADEVVGDVMQRMMQLGLTSSQAMRDTGIALDFATRREIDYATAADLIAKAHSGSVGMLQKLGFQFTKGASDAKIFQEALEQMARVGMGALEEQTSTGMGSWNTFVENLKELAEGIGSQVLPGFTKVMSYVNRMNELEQYVNEGIVKLPQKEKDILQAYGMMPEGSEKDVDKYIKQGRDYTDILIAAKKALVELHDPAAKIPKDFELSSMQLENLVRLIPSATKLGLDYADALKRIETYTKEWNAITDKQSAAAQEAAAKIVKAEADAAKKKKKLQEAETDYAEWLQQRRLDSFAAYIKAMSDMSMAEMTYIKKIGSEMRDPRFNLEKSPGFLSSYKNSPKTGKPEFPRQYTGFSSPDTTAIERLQIKIDKLKDTDLGAALFGSLDNAAQRAANGIARVFMGEKVQFAEIWKGMAQDFISYFFEAILKHAAEVFVVKLIEIMGIFDNPINDRMAYRSGEDYAKHHMKGSLEYFAKNTNNLLPAMTGVGNGQNIGGSANVIIIGGGGDYESTKKRLRQEISNGSLDFITRKNIKQALITLDGIGMR